VRRFAGLVLVPALLAGCGSTVPLATQSQAAGGLSAPGSVQGTAPSGTSQLPGTSAGGASTTGSNGTSAGGVQPGAAVPAGSTTSAVSPQGVRSSAPLTIGVVLTKTSNAESFGVSTNNTVTEQKVDDAVIAGINEHGGLAGRKLVPVYASTDTGSSNWDTDFAAACATFTQDHHVVAVLGYVFNYVQSFERCLATKGIPHLSTAFNVPDRPELAKFPLQIDLVVPTIDRRGLLKLENGAADGVLTPKSRIGVITDTCPGSPTSLNQVFLPKAKQLGLTVAKVVSVSCPNGNADSSSAVGTLQNAVLQFASSGVDRVIFHASSEGPALLLFSLSAESQHYRPEYVVSSLANLDALHSYVPAAQISNIHGYGWMPTQDVPPSAYPKPNALQARCLGLLRSKKITPVAGTDFAYAYEFCESVFVYERALLATGGDSTGTKVASAVKALGTSFASLTNEGGSIFSADRPDAPRFARHLVYAATCKCFTYTGPTRTIPTS